MIEGYFPGSRVPLTQPAGLRDPLAGEEGKTFTIAGQEVELFTIGQVATLLNRTPIAIRKWERLHIIPRATYKKPGVDGDPRGSRRLYSRQQVEALVQIAEEEGILHNKSKRIGTTQFSPKVWTKFRELAAR